MNPSALFALFTRSLREETRNKFPYIGRVLLALCLLIFLGFVHQASRSVFGTAPGKMYFTSLLYLNLIFFSLVGLSIFSSAITEEKEELSLGLLRMTNLNPLSILLGKSTSRLFNASLFILAQVPFTMLAITLGGISMLQVIASYVLLLSYLFFHANVCLLASVICQRTRTAATLAATILIALYMILPWLIMVIQSNAGTAGAAPTGPLLWIVEFSPFVQASKVLSSTFAGPVFSIPVISHLIGGLVLFILSWLLFDRFSREQKEPAPSRGLVLKRTSSIRPLRLGRCSNTMPIFWRDFHFFRGGWPSMIVRFLSIGLVIGIIIFTSYLGSRSTPDLEDIGGFMFGTSIFLLCLELAVIASRVYKQEVQWKTLSSLATLPKPLSKTAYEKLWAALSGTIPTLTFLFVGFLLSDISISDLLRGDGLLGLFYFGTTALATLHLITLLSLYLKWGALPLGLFGGFFINMVIFTMFSAMFIMAGSPTPVMILIGTVWLICAGVMHRAIGKRLHTLAARE